MPHPLSLTSLALLHAVSEAPVTDVTVFGDRARVTRTAKVNASGQLEVEFPLLQPSVDVSTIRVEAKGAEVRRVDVQASNEDAFPVDEAKKLLAELNAHEDLMAKSSGELSLVNAQISLLSRIQPQTPQAESERPVPKLTAAGWAQVLAFPEVELEKLQSRRRALTVKSFELSEKHRTLLEKARILGGVGRRQGQRVKAIVEGSGQAEVALTYVANRARWLPAYDLELAADTGKVQLSFHALVSQETGEDWKDAKLAVSTAMPVYATVLPKLSSWKIGERDRFVPQPYPQPEVVRPPPLAPPLPKGRPEVEILRERLHRELSEQGISSSRGPAAPPPGPAAEMDMDYGLDELEASGGLGQAAPSAPMARPPPKPTYRPSPPAAKREYARETVSAAAAPDEDYESSPGRSAAYEPPPEPQGSLQPPRAWIQPPPPPESPAALAGGYDLVFPAPRDETVETGKGSRRIPLLSEIWPVDVERKLFPGVTKDVYLVAEIKSPSQKVLPSGQANLFVGADPAGQAKLPLVSPGEAFTLPLGLDRGLKPVRNVKLLQEEKGFIGKDEVNSYLVTVEVSNPYSTPVKIRIHDQWPVSDSKGLEVKLLETKPYAIQDKPKGTLEWRLTIPPRGKQAVSFTYSLRRPKGWKLSQ